MVKTIIKRLSLGTASTALAFMGMAGVASASTGGHYSGWDKLSSYSNTRNNNNVHINNDNYQNARSGSIYLTSTGGSYGDNHYGYKDDKKHDYKDDKKCDKHSSHKDSKHGSSSSSFEVGDISTGHAKNYNQSDYFVGIVNKHQPSKESKTVSYDKKHKKPTSHSVQTQVNNNTVNITNSNEQHATSGSVYLTSGGSGGGKHSRSSSSVGDVSTGNASNYNQTQAEVEITNNTSSPTYQLASHSKKKPSHSSTSTTNNNNVSIDNSSEQHATSGSVYLTSGGSGGGKHSRSSSSVGDVSTGNASNYNSSEFAVVIEN